MKPRLGAGAWALAGVLPALWALVDVLRGGALFERDVHLSWHAHAWAFRRAVAGGELPLWDPLWGFGQPHWANPQTQSAYPTTWLLLLLEPWAAYSVIVLLHVAWAALGASALGRRLGLSPAAAAGAGALFAASGPMLSMANLWHQLCGAAWLPWVALAGLRTLAAPAPVPAALWGVALALQVLAGSGEMALAGALLSAGLALAAAIRPRASSRAAALAAALGAAVLGVSLSAAAWWPALDVAARSAREGLDAAARTYWSVRPGAVAQLFLPVPVDTLPRPALDPLVSREDAEPLFASLYLGLPTLGLLAAAAASPRRGLAAGLAALAGLAVAFALGRHAPVHALVEALVPPLHGLRFPVKAMAPAALAFALLAAVGVEACARADGAGRRARRLAALALGAGLLIATAVALLPAAPAPFPRPFPAPRPALLAPGLAALALASMAGLARAGRPAQGALALAAAAAVEVATAHRGMNAVAPPELLRFRPPTLDALPPAARIHVWDYRARPAGKRHPERDLRGFFLELPPGLPPALARALGLQHYLFPSTAGRHGLAGSFSNDLMRLYPLPLRDLVQLQRDSAETPGYVRLLRLGSVDDVLALHADGHPGLREVRRLPGGFAAAIHVLAVPEPLPRARAVAGVRVADGWDAYRLLLDPAVDLDRELVLAAGVARGSPPGFGGEVREVSRRTASLAFAVSFSDDGFLVVSDAWDPGWQAEVDAQPTPVLRANVAFRAVAVPRGHHRVTMSYRPAAFSRGVAVSAVGLLALAALAASAALRRGRPRPAS